MNCFVIGRKRKSRTRGSRGSRYLLSPSNTRSSVELASPPLQVLSRHGVTHTNSQISAGRVSQTLSARSACTVWFVRRGVPPCPGGSLSSCTEEFLCSVAHTVKDFPRISAKEFRRRILGTIHRLRGILKLNWHVCAVRQLIAKAIINGVN